MEPMKLSFGVLIVYLNQVILQMKDPRLASNGTKYTITDAVCREWRLIPNTYTALSSYMEYTNIVGRLI